MSSTDHEWIPCESCDTLVRFADYSEHVTVCVRRHTMPGLFDHFRNAQFPAVPSRRYTDTGGLDPTDDDLEDADRDEEDGDEDDDDGLPPQPSFADILRDLINDPQLRANGANTAAVAAAGGTYGDVLLPFSLPYVSPVPADILQNFMGSGPAPYVPAPGLPPAPAPAAAELEPGAPLVNIPSFADIVRQALAAQNALAPPPPPVPELARLFDIPFEELGGDIETGEAGMGDAEGETEQNSDVVGGIAAAPDQITLMPLPPATLNALVNWSRLITTETAQQPFNEYEFNLMLANLIGKVEKSIGNIDAVSKVVPVEELAEQVCPICQECADEIREKHTNLRMTTCKHMFCEPCIAKWFEKNVKCPVCLTELDDTQNIEKQEHA